MSDPFPGSSAYFYEEIQKKNTEIERLKTDRKLSDELMVSRARHFDEMVALKNAIITQLCDALELPFEEWTDQSDLIHRAREATKDE